MSEYIIAIYKYTDELLKKRTYLQLPAHVIDLCIFPFVDTVYITEEHNIVYIYKYYMQYIKTVQHFVDNQTTILNIRYLDNPSFGTHLLLMELI